MARLDTMRNTSGAKDVLWMLVAATALALGILSVVQGIRSGAYENLGPIHVLIAIPFALGIYWLTVGAWRRTSWGQDRQVNREDPVSPVESRVQRTRGGWPR
jgi:hypothetical protein